MRMLARIAGFTCVHALLEGIFCCNIPGDHQEPQPQPQPPLSAAFRSKIAVLES